MPQPVEVDGSLVAAHLAYEIGVMKPLRDYVASAKPVPQDIVLLKGRLVEQDMPSLVA